MIILPRRHQYAPTDVRKPEHRDRRAFDDDEGHGCLLSGCLTEKYVPPGE
jgi:hypothetical protein